MAGVLDGGSNQKNTAFQTQAHCSRVLQGVSDGSKHSLLGMIIPKTTSTTNATTTYTEESSDKEVPNAQRQLQYLFDNERLTTQGTTNDTNEPYSPSMLAVHPIDASPVCPSATSISLASITQSTQTATNIASPQKSSWERGICLSAVLCHQSGYTHPPCGTSTLLMPSYETIAIAATIASIAEL